MAKDKKTEEAAPAPVPTFSADIGRATPEPDRVVSETKADERDGMIVSLQSQVDKLTKQLAKNHLDFIEAHDLIERDNHRLLDENAKLKASPKAKSSSVDLGANFTVGGVSYVVSRQESTRDAVEQIMKRHVSEDAIIVILEKAGS